MAPAPEFLPEKSHGQRSLVGYSSWGQKESDTTEWLNWTDCWKKNFTKAIAGRKNYKLILVMLKKTWDLGTSLMVQGLRLHTKFLIRELRSYMAYCMAKIYICVCSVTQSCPTFCIRIDCNPSGSSVHGISQARILEWISISSRGSSQPRDIY